MNVSKRSFPLAPPGIQFQIGAAEARAAFAVLRQAGSALNAELARRVPKDVWALVAVEGYRLTAQRYSNKPGEIGRTVRDVRTVAQQRYAAVRLTIPDLTAAVRATP